MNDSLIAAPLERDGSLGKDDVSAHQPRLLAGALHQGATGDPMRKARIISDQRARAGLSARDGLFKQNRVESLRRGVHGGGQASRPGADDGELAGVYVVLDLDADRGRKIGEGRIDGDLTVVTDHDGQARAFNGGSSEQAPSIVAVARVEP